MRAGVVGLVVLLLAGCNGQIEEENVATTSDGGVPPADDASAGTLDATIVDAATGPRRDASAGACASDGDCNGGTCFEGLCMCQAPDHVQPDGRCGTDPPKGCAEGGGACRQSPPECHAGELEGDVDTSRGCGDLVAAVCCFAASTCKTTIDFVCCGASATPYEPSCVNGWRTCAGAGPTPRLRSQGCP